MNVGQVLPCSFGGNLISFLPMNIVIALCVLHGNLLDHLGKLLTENEMAINTAKL